MLLIHSGKYEHFLFYVFILFYFIPYDWSASRARSIYRDDIVHRYLLTTLEYKDHFRFPFGNAMSYDVKTSELVEQGASGWYLKLLSRQFELEWISYTRWKFIIIFQLWRIFGRYLTENSKKKIPGEHTDSQQDNAENDGFNSQSFQGLFVGHIVSLCLPRL